MMTKTDKTGIFLIDMRVQVKGISIQWMSLQNSAGFVFLLLCFACICACTVRKEETPVIPPATSPLTRNYIGYGVITASFTHITIDPDESSLSLGYLRRGDSVRVLRRQSIRDNGFSSWVYIDANQQGWLKEEVIDIYDNESQARTASESMSR